ncbi:MAG: hypothetical protein J6B60_02695 [Clostridia bacterium]|nr:hypothetical protein [Clostridia bacterium]
MKKLTSLFILISMLLGIFVSCDTSPEITENESSEEISIIESTDDNTSESSDLPDESSTVIPDVVPNPPEQTSTTEPEPIDPTPVSNKPYYAELYYSERDFLPWEYKYPLLIDNSEEYDKIMKYSVERLDAAFFDEYSLLIFSDYNCVGYRDIKVTPTSIELAADHALKATKHNSVYERSESSAIKALAIPKEEITVPVNDSFKLNITDYKSTNRFYISEEFIAKDVPWTEDKVWAFDYSMIAEAGRLQINYCEETTPISDGEVLIIFYDHREFENLEFFSVSATSKENGLSIILTKNFINGKGNEIVMPRFYKFKMSEEEYKGELGEITDFSIGHIDRYSSRRRIKNSAFSDYIEARINFGCDDEELNALFSDDYGIQFKILKNSEEMKTAFPSKKYWSYHHPFNEGDYLIAIYQNYESFDKSIIGFHSFELNGSELSVVASTKPSSKGSTDYRLLSMLHLPRELGDSKIDSIKIVYENVEYLDSHTVEIDYYYNPNDDEREYTKFFTSYEDWLKEFDGEQYADITGETFNDFYVFVYDRIEGISGGYIIGYKDAYYDNGIFYITLDYSGAVFGNTAMYEYLDFVLIPKSAIGGEINNICMNSQYIPQQSEVIW